MRAIVTGATGFIGIALCKELLEQLYEVTAVIRPGSKKREKLEQSLSENKFPQNHLRILELPLDQLTDLSEKYHIEADVFFHLAWNGSSGSDREIFEVQYKNLQYTANAIQAAKACGCTKIIGAGSQAEYGVVRGIAREEKTVPRPFMMYGAAKLAAYHMGKVLAEQIGITFVWPRIYSVYGVGENQGTLVNYVIDTLKKGEVPQLTSCENMWNFMYITDCVRALRILGEAPHAEGIYHVASKDARMLKDFVKEIRDVIAPTGQLQFGAKACDLSRTFWMEPECDRLYDLSFECRVDFANGIQSIGVSEI